DRPGGALIDTVAVRVGGGESCQAGPRPRVEGNSQCAREHPGPQRPDDLNVGGGKPLRKQLYLAYQYRAGPVVGAVVAAHAFDLPPSAPGIDLQADEQLVVPR